MQRIGAPVMALALAGCTGGLPESALTRFEADGWNGETHTYRCADGARLAVTYLNPHQGVDLVVITAGGNQAVLRNLPAASGALYVDVDEQRGLRWHAKGDTGFLNVLAADHTATEQPLHSGCQLLP